jgi:hypothetical protein
VRINSALAAEPPRAIAFLQHALTAPKPSPLAILGDADGLREAAKNAA